MKKALSIFIPTFLIVLAINQMMYGSCFKGYCLAAAFPKVTILSLMISTFIFFVSNSDDEQNKGNKNEN